MESEIERMDKMILPSDDKAAEKITMELWRSRRGTLFTDEDAARWDGATHVGCTGCQIIVEKGRGQCPVCLENAKIARFHALPEAEWDGTTGMVFSQALDKFFPTWSDVCDMVLNKNLTMRDLRLIICEPVYLRKITGDNFYDQLPDDGKMPGDVAQAIDDFNQVLREHGPVSWTPGNAQVKI